MATSLFSPRIRRFGERLSLLIFFSGCVYFLWRGSQFPNGVDDSRLWVSLALSALCLLQFGVLLWAQRRRRLLESDHG
jgi:hypothetical protein